MQTREPQFARGAHGSGDVALLFTSDAPLTFQGKASDEWDWVKQQYVTESIPVKKGEILEVSAWVNVGEDIQGTKRGALLWANRVGVAVIAGYGEVVRAKRTRGWEQLRQIVVTDREEMAAVSLRVALCGRGKAYIDDLCIRRLVE